jgi:tRNA A-37 threonylcarbamoyl transferase component Bud32
MDARFATWRLDDLHVAHATEIPAESFARGRDACLKWGPGSSVSHVLIRTGAGDLDLAVKWIPWRGWRGALSDALHGSRARRALAASARLASSGLSAPEVLAVAERRSLGVVRESFLLTRFLRDADPLPVAMARVRERTARRRALLRALGEAIGALHAAGFDHRDLKHSNLMVGPDRRIAFLDLEALGHLAPFDWRRRARALGELESYARDLYGWLPGRERLCFLSAYLRAQPALVAHKEKLVRAAQREAERGVARWLGRTRPAERHFPLAPRDVNPCTVADAVAPPGSARGSRG